MRGCLNVILLGAHGSTPLQLTHMFCRNSVRWVYRLEQSYSWNSGHGIPEDLVFRDKTSAVRLIIERDGRITVTRGYAWDACTPKFSIFDILVGVPDGVVHAGTGRPKTYYASLVPN